MDYERYSQSRVSRVLARVVVSLLICDIAAPGQNGMTTL